MMQDSSSRKIATFSHSVFFENDEEENDSDYFYSDGEDEDENDEDDYVNNQDDNTNQEMNPLLLDTNSERLFATTVNANATRTMHKVSSYTVGERLPLLSTDGRGKSLSSSTSSPSMMGFDTISKTAISPPSVCSSSVDGGVHLEAPIIHVMDRLEDEMEVHAYDDLVPLDIKLALEDKVFGWTHLTSTFFGHTVFVLGSYWIVYTACTIACNNNLCFGLSVDNNNNDYYESSSSSFSTDQEEQEQQQQLRAIAYFQLVRVTLALWAAVSTYRMVRRRRRIWFRAPYGSRAYKQDEARRRQVVQETDRTTVLGRMIGKFLERRVHKKLRKAESYYAKKHQQRQQLVQIQEVVDEEITTVVRSTTARQGLYCRSFSSCSGRSLSSSSLEEDGYSSSSSSSGQQPQQEQRSQIYQNENIPDVMNDRPEAEEEDEDKSKVQHQLQESCPSSSSSLAFQRQKHKRRPSFHTDPTNQMQSVGHDQILFQTIHNIPYAHGGFFGAAPFLLANPHWISILRHLLPDVYVEISRRVLSSPAPKLIHWAENNPVVAAYGAAHELEYNNNNNDNNYVCKTKKEAEQNNNSEGAMHGISKSKIPNLEWDVFLDPHLIRRVQVVLDAQDKYLASLNKPETGRGSTSESDRTTILDDDNDDNNDDDSDNDQNDVGYFKQPTLSDVSKGSDKSSSSISSSSKHILAYYDYELKRRSQALVDKMLIAHGNLNHLILEITGYAKRYNYSRVKRTRRSLGGGIYARQWMAVFAEALKLGLQFDELKNACEMMAQQQRQQRQQQQAESMNDIKESAATSNSTSRTNRKNTSLLALADSKCPDMTMAESIEVVRSIAKCDQPIGIILDVKSRHVPKHIWSIVVNTLRTSGLRVEGLGTFYGHEIRNVSQYCLQPVQEIYFFHSAGDVQRACHEGRLQMGDTVFFNAGSLLWDPSSTPASTTTTTGTSSNPCSVLDQISRFDPTVVKQSYEILPFGCSSLSDDNNNKSSMTKFGGHTGSTLEMYKNKFNLSIGMYLQEFAIDETAADILAKHVNRHPHIFDLGLSWGGVNGITVKGIRPGRFTATDGFWNQRYLGHTWDDSLMPLSPQTFENECCDDVELKEGLLKQ